MTDGQTQCFIKAGACFRRHHSKRHTRKIRRSAEFAANAISVRLAIVRDVFRMSWEVRNRLLDQASHITHGLAELRLTELIHHRVVA